MQRTVHLPQNIRNACFPLCSQRKKWSEYLYFSSKDNCSPFTICLTYIIINVSSIIAVRRLLPRSSFGERRFFIISGICTSHFFMSSSFCPKGQNKVQEKLSITLFLVVEQTLIKSRQQLMEYRAHTASFGQQQYRKGGPL